MAEVQDNEMTYAKAFGQANLAEDWAADASMHYAIGSVNRQRRRDESRRGTHECVRHKAYLPWLSLRK